MGDATPGLWALPLCFLVIAIVGSSQAALLLTLGLLATGYHVDRWRDWREAQTLTVAMAIARDG